MAQTETSEILKKLTKKKTSGLTASDKKEVSNICTDAMYSLIHEGKLESVYDSEEACLDALKEAFTNLVIEDTIRKRYISEAQYEDTPKIAVKYGKITKSLEAAFGIKLDRDYIGLYKYPKVTCGECGETCTFELNEEKNYGEYFCPACGAHVRTHEGTDIPLGVPVGSKTAKKRIKIHKEIDRLVSEGYDKNNVYRLLSKKMGKEKK